MASKVAEAYVQLSAKTEQLQTDLKKGQQLTKGNTEKMAQNQKQADANEKKIQQKKNQEKLKDQKTMFTRMADLGSKVRSALTGAFNAVASSMNTVAVGGAGLIASFVAFARASEFPHAKILAKQFDALSNELYMALMPAIQMLFPIFERLRVVVFQNRGFFQDMGTIAAKALGFLVEVLNKVLRMWEKIPAPVRETIMVVAAIAIPVAIVGAKLMFLLPLIGKIAAAFSGLSLPVMFLAGAVLSVVAALGYAAASDQWGVRMAAAFEKVYQVAMFVKEGIMDALARVWAIVQPRWEQFVELAVQKFEAITDWLDQNKETFTEWANLVGEIVGNCVNICLDLWQGFWDFFGGLMSWLSDITGITWGGIKDTISAVLDWISLVTSNMKLSIQIAWTAIKLAAVVTWDFITNAFWRMIGGIAGGFTSLVAAAKAVWHNICAVFNGDDFVSVSGAMAEQFGRTYNSVTAGRLGQSEARQQLMDELRSLNDELNKGRAAQRERTDKAVAQNREARERARQEDKAKDNAGAPPPVMTVKFETIGLKDMWKKVQEQMTGGTMIALAQRQAKAAEENVRVNRDMAENIKKIANKPADEGGARVG